MLCVVVHVLHDGGGAMPDVCGEHASVQLVASVGG